MYVLRIQVTPHLSLKHARELRKVAFIHARATGWGVFKAQYTTIHWHSYTVLCPYVKIGKGIITCMDATVHTITLTNYSDQTGLSP